MKCNCRNSLRMLIISPLASGPSPDDRDKLKSNSAGPKPDSDHYHYLVFWRLEPQYLLFLSLTRKAATTDITQWRGLIGESEATRGYFISSKLIKSKLAFRLSPAPRLAVKMSNLGCLIMSSQDPDLGHLAIWQVEMSGEERTEELTREAGRGWTPTLWWRQWGCLLYQADTWEHWGTLGNTEEHWGTLGDTSLCQKVRVGSQCRHVFTPSVQHWLAAWVPAWPDNPRPLPSPFFPLPAQSWLSCSSVP